MDVEVACDSVRVFEFQKGGLGGNRVGRGREWSGISVADRKAGEPCAEAALWGENI